MKILVKKDDSAVELDCTEEHAREMIRVHGAANVSGVGEDGCLYFIEPAPDAPVPDAVEVVAEGEPVAPESE